MNSLTLSNCFDHVGLVSMQPHYEKVARVFNGPTAAHPGIILMTRVDCALKVPLNCFLIAIMFIYSCVRKSHFFNHWGQNVDCVFVGYTK